jgi:arylsulfatase A-like enzyme
VHTPGSDGPSEAELASMRAGAAPATWGHAVRLGDWKGVSFALGAPLELYNVTADVGEAHNLAAAHPEVVAQLEAIAAAAHADSPNFPVEGCVGS